MAEETTGKEYPIDLYDDENGRRFNIINKRIEMAYASILAGIGSVRFSRELRAHADKIGDDHPLWRISVDGARKLLQRARIEMGKDMAKTRASALAAQLQRLEMLYSRAIEKSNDALALSILREINEMHDRVTGYQSNEREKKSKALRGNSQVRRALKKFAESVSRHTQGSVERTGSVEPDAS